MTRRSPVHNGIVAALLAALVAGLIAVGQSSAGAEIPGFIESPNLSDNFDRTVGGGFGSAPTGGPYDSYGSGTSVDGHGVLRLVEPGSASGVRLADLRTDDQRVDAVLDLPNLPTAGNGVYVGLELRRQPAEADRAYLATARIAPDGTVTLGVSRADGTDEISLGPGIPAAGKIAAGQRLAVQAYVTGRQPVEIGIRAHPADQPGDDWLIRQDADPDRITGPGTVGIRGYLSQQSEPTQVRLYELRGAALASTGQVGHEPERAPAGSVPVGEAAYPVPEGAIFVAPTGDDGAAGTEAAPLRTLYRATEVAPDGATVVVRAGSYTERVFVPDGKRLTIQPYPGEQVWLDGSVVIPNWQQADAGWQATLPAEFDASASHVEGSDEGGFVNPDYPMAAHPDQVFVDGRQLAQVPTGQVPGPMEFAVDYAADQLIVGADPRGHEVRASVLSRAVVAAGPLTLRGIGVRRYATALPKMGTVYLGGRAEGSVLENLVVEDNATQGISVGITGVLIDRVTSRNNGMTGIHGAYADGLVIRNALITGNNTQRFNQEPAAAGIKIGRTRGVTLTGNLIEGNHGINGIWLDESVVGFTVARNRIRTGADAQNGILAELSDTGVIAGNDVAGPRYGITIYNSGRVVVANNLVRDTSVWDIGLTQDERRQASHPVGRDPRQPVPDPSCPWEIRDITVINNVFAGAQSGDNPGFQFYALDKRTRVPVDAMNVIIDGNLFSDADGTEADRMVAWGGGDNETITVYQQPRGLALAKNAGWTNLLTASVRPGRPELDRLRGSAVGLPEQVAAALGRPAGSRLLGPA